MYYSLTDTGFFLQLRHISDVTELTYSKLL